MAWKRVTAQTSNNTAHVVENQCFYFRENSLDSDVDANTPPPVAIDTLATAPTMNENPTNDDTTEDYMTITPDYPDENQPHDKERSETPPLRNAPDNEGDLSFSGEASPTALSPHSKPTSYRPTKQTTITSLFSAKGTTDTEPTREPTPPCTFPSNTPQLASMDDFLLERDEELTVELKLDKIVTPLEQFQQRFTQNAVKSQANKIKVKTENKGGEKNSLIPEEIAAKLGDTPG